MIRMIVKGSFKHSQKWLKRLNKVNPKFRAIMEKYGNAGVEALREATPKDTGETSGKWRYKIENWGLAFFNDEVNDGARIAVLLQFGHATRSGQWVYGVDYINPALKSIFDKIAQDLRREVGNL